MPHVFASSPLLELHYTRIPNLARMNLDANYALTIMPLLLLALVLVLPCPYSDPEPTTPVSPRLWKEGPKTQVEEDTPKPKPWDSTLHLRSESRKSAESMDLGRSSGGLRNQKCQTLTLTSDYVFQHIERMPSQRKGTKRQRRKTASPTETPTNASSSSPSSYSASPPPPPTLLLPR